MSYNGILSYFSMTYSDGDKIAVACYEDGLLLSNGFFAVRTGYTQEVLKLIGLPKGIFPENGTILIEDGRRVESHTFDLVQIWTTQEQSSKEPLALTRWLYEQDELLTRVFRTPKNEAVLVQRKFLNTLTSHVWKLQGYFEFFTGDVDKGGAAPVLAYNAGLLVGIFMPIKTKPLLDWPLSVDAGKINTDDLHAEVVCG